MWPYFCLLWPPAAIVFALDGILIGAGDTRYLALAMVVSAAVYVPLAFAALAFDWGIVGVWCAVLALMGMRLATLAVRFAGRRWALVGAATWRRGTGRSRQPGTPARAPTRHAAAKQPYRATASFNRRSMSSSRSKSASSAWRYSTPRPASSVGQRLDVVRVELLARDAPQLVERLERGHRRPVGVGRRQRVVDLGDRDDARDRRDLLAVQAARVAAAVDPLVMRADDVGDRPVDADVAQKLARRCPGGGGCRASRSRAACRRAP